MVPCPSRWRESWSNCAARPSYNRGLFLQLRIINRQAQIETARARPVWNSRTDWLLLAGFCAFLFFYGLSNFGLIGADEPRYAQIAREMLARHDWVTPVLGGEPWLEKPPLYYWQAMMAYSIFGVSDWAARLPSAVDATLMVIVIYWFSRKYLGVELDAALITASTAGVIGFARAASTDMPLAAMFAIAMLGWFARCKSNSRTYLACAYVFLGLATLAKGPVAPFLAGVIVGIFAIVSKDYKVVRRTFWIPGIVIFLAVTLPWYIAVQVKNPDFFRIFILQHNFERFGTGLYHHKQPFWYFVPVTLLALVPWTVLTSVSLAQDARAWWADRGPSSEHDLDTFLVLWLLVPVLFFSASQSKLPGYILPAVPAGALLAARYLRRHISSEQRLSLGVVILHSIVAAAPIVPTLMMQYLVMQHRLPWGRAAAISFAFAGTLAIALIFTLRSRVGLGGIRFTLVPVTLGLAAVLRLGAPALDSTLSARPIANEIRRIENERLPLAVFHIPREVEYGLAFYRNQKIEQYGLGRVPAEAHILVAPEGNQIEVAKQVPGRRVSYLGSYAPQGLDYYWVGASNH